METFSPAQLPTPPQQRRRPWLAVALGALVVLLLLCVAGALVLTRLTGGNGVVNNGDTYQSSLRAPGGADGWVTDANCVAGTDGYHIKSSYICYAPVAARADATMTVSVKQTDGEDTYLFYGIVLRRVSAGNYYMYSVDSEGKWRFGKVVDGTYHDIVKEQYSDALGDALSDGNTIAVTAKGQRFTFFINKTQVGTASDATFSSGLWGLSGCDDIEVVYTDIKLTQAS